MAAMGRFDWADPFALDAQLTDEERMVRDAARAYAQEQLLPRVTKAFLDEDFDRGIMSEMGQLGLLGPTIPETYGGAGLGYVAYGLVAAVVMLWGLRTRRLPTARQALAAQVLTGLDYLSHPSSYFLWLPLAEEFRADQIAMTLQREHISVSTAEPFAVSAQVPHALRLALGSVAMPALREALVKVRKVVAW